MSVRERLADRAGKLRLSRLGRRLGREEGVPLDLRVADSDNEFVLPEKSSSRKKKKGKRRPRRSRSRGRRRRSRSSSSDSSSSSSSSRQVFRGASAAAAGQSRAARDAKKLPHLVLVDTLTQICQTLPKTAAGANLSRAQIFQQLPPVFVAWFSLILLPALKAKTTGGLHNEREARTIVEICDALLTGDTLGAFMILLGRLRAITSVVMPEGGAGSWALAQHFEVLQTNQTGLLTQRDRQNAQLDLRDTQRAMGSRGGGGQPRRQGAS